MLLRRIDSLLLQLRGAFRRQATFGWFVIVVFAFMLRLDVYGVSSIVRCFALAPLEYHNLLGFFHSSAFSIQDLCKRWVQLVFDQAPRIAIRGMPLAVIDVIKVGKEGRKMPGVKKLHQESDNNTKPEYIMGHLWGAVSALASAGKGAFAIPLRLEIQDGIKRSPAEKATLIDKMSALVISTIRAGSLLVTDSYYCTKGFINSMLEANISFIAKCRINCVGHLPGSHEHIPGKRGRKRKYGPKIRLRDLFEEPRRMLPADIHLWGKRFVVLYRCVDLFWQGVPVRFVVTLFPDGTRGILLCTNRMMSAVEIIAAYSLRFKIEVSFKVLVHLLGGFAYHFWMKAMPKISRKTGDQYLHRASQYYRAQVWRKVEAYERFVNIAGVALGILQLLAMEYPRYLGQRFPVWFRTLPEHGCPSENMVRLTLQWEIQSIYSKSRHYALIREYLSKRRKAKLPSHPFKMAS